MVLGHFSLGWPENFSMHTFRGQLARAVDYTDCISVEGKF